MAILQLLNRITITRPVLIKTIVTEQYKQQAAAGLQQELAALDASLAAIKQRLQQLAAPEGAAEQNALQQLRRQLEDNWRQTGAKRARVLEQLKALARLPLGAEVVQGRAESLVEVAPGDNLNDLLQVEIVVRDGVIEQIRQGEKTCPSK